MVDHSDFLFVQTLLECSTFVFENAVDGKKRGLIPAVPLAGIAGLATFALLAPPIIGTAPVTFGAIALGSICALICTALCVCIGVGIKNIIEKNTETKWTDRITGSAIKNVVNISR